MATNNITFPIYNADGTPFNGLVLRNATFDSVVMSLGDKITGDVYYRDNTLAVTMSEYIEYKRNEDSEAVRFVLVNPPTVVREGMVSDNSELRGATKYSFVFYHPMCVVSNFPFTDVAVSSNEQKYLSNSKTFSWIGNLFDMVAKLNKNLQGTQWVVGTNIEHYDQDGVTETSMWQKAAKIPDEPLSFDKTYVSEVLKTSYETWEIPFVVDQIAPTDSLYAQGKRFLILFGTPSNEILDDQGHPYIFRFGQGVGLKNNSRTPKNNKIVTRIIGYGSENNIPFGYPQIQWFGDQTWKYTVNNDLSAEGSLPIYKGILGGQYVNLIKHPFTRKTLMPSVYRETLFNKVSPYMSDGTPNPNFDPTIELVDYYDADGSYANPVVEGAESVEIHQFEDIKPEFGKTSIVADAIPYNAPEDIGVKEITYVNAFLGSLLNKITTVKNENEKAALLGLYNAVNSGVASYHDSNTGGSYTFSCDVTTDENFYYVKYVSDNVNYDLAALKEGHVAPETTAEWIDDIDDDGNYKQSYFKMTLPQLDFDLYACASITEEMKINMRSGACIGCTFDIAVDWDDYKRNFYDSDGNFAPDGEQRDLTKYPKTNLGQVTFVVKKDLDTFGTLMPNTYQQPHSGDEFVILGISLPTTYITNAEARLDDAAKEYMRENNVHYYEYPLKFDEHFLATHTNILSQIRNNTIVRFQYGGELPMALYVKQMTIKYSGVLPTYDITLTDDVEIVLNQIGQVTDDVSRMRVQVSELQKYYSENIIQAINEKLSKVVDDVCQGRITFQQGLDSIGSAIFHDEIRSPQFEAGLYVGRGWRIDQLGNAEMESLRVRSYLEVVELLINRLQAQEGDTVFTDNDQIEHVEEKKYNNTTYYVLSLKEKWEGYITSQQKDNILKGIINTLAANYGNVSDITEEQCVETDGVNKYYTSWMKVIDPSDVGETLGRNQIAVMLYEDTDTPANKNFPPCELMTIARYGCDADPDNETLTEGERQSIIRRQSVFSISTSDGRIAKLRGVRTPIMQNVNYGTTLGTIPDFIKQWSVYSRLNKNRDYLYAQGVIVSDFIKVDSVGDPITNYVDAGQWQDNTPYLHNAYNEQNAQWETNDVWHDGAYWRCLVTQPYNGVYYEPTDANNLYWQKLLTSGQNGTPAPFYTEEWYAWSNDASTASADDTPTIGGSWQSYIPAQGSYAYLWKKVTRWRWNATLKIYEAGNPQYYRLSGTNGTSIDIKGHVATVTDLPSVHSDGDAYVVDANGHLYVWSDEGSQWVDIGLFQGENGKTYYTHIAWATNVVYSEQTGEVIRVDGFVIAKSPDDTTHLWMGVLVNEDSSTDSSVATDYTWSYTKGVDGISVQAQYSPDGSQIHNTWQNGDIYMRTKQSNETSWSGWHKIVGENGGETDYSFNISKEKTSANATTPPSNCYHSTWQDAPISPTSTYPYLWMKIQKKDGDGNNVGNASYARITGEKGDKGNDAQYIYIRGTGYNNDAERILNITSATNVFSAYGSRGFVAARINRNTLTVSGITWFDVYGGASEGSGAESDTNANAARTRFVTYLANTTSDYFIAVASKDAIGLNDAMVAKLREFGLGELDYTAVSGYAGFRTPFAFLGYKGLQQGYALYQLHGEGANEPYAEVMAYVSNGIFMSSKDGKDGARGKVGRFFYFGGTFNSQDNDPTHGFVVNDAQAPYFEHTVNGQKCYHVFNYDTNGTYTMSQMWAISSNWNNKPWEVMTNDFKYIITEALFTDFAKLGSGVFNKDWLLSAYGKREKVLKSSSSSINQGTNYNYIKVPNMTSIDVIEGNIYSFYITCYSASGYDLFAQVAISTDGGSNYDITGEFYATGDSTSHVDVLSFRARFTGKATLFYCGIGTITKVVTYDDSTISGTNTGYRKFTPSFPNTDYVHINASNAGGGIGSTTYSYVSLSKFTVVQGMTYKLQMDGIIQSGSGTCYVSVYKYSDNTPINLYGAENTEGVYYRTTTDGGYYRMYFDSNFTRITKAASFTPNFSGEIVVMGRISSSGVVGNLQNMILIPVNPFVPKVAIDWLSGYAHFGGDSVHFNPNGSGWLSNKNIKWDENGNSEFSGRVHATGGEFSGSNNGFEIKLDGDNRILAVNGPIGVKGLNDMTPSDGAKTVEYLRLGQFLTTGSYYNNGGERYYFIYPMIVLRSYHSNIQGTSYKQITINGDGLTITQVQNGSPTKHWNFGPSASYLSNQLFITDYESLPTSRDATQSGGIYRDGETLKIRID